MKYEIIRLEKEGGLRLIPETEEEGKMLRQVESELDHQYGRANYCLRPSSMGNELDFSIREIERLPNGHFKSK
ncbi:MAG: hypothetical protein KKD18_07120 [Nanoarchaeota archaeon]|nr:hypothetical protein [Nanoarchaeota archaeon]